LAIWLTEQHRAESARLKIFLPQTVHFGANAQQFELRLEYVLENVERSEADLCDAFHGVLQRGRVGDHRIRDQ
jgi:hypothetical protein